MQRKALTESTKPTPNNYKMERIERCKAMTRKLKDRISEELLRVYDRRIYERIGSHIPTSPRDKEFKDGLQSIFYNNIEQLDHLIGDAKNIYLFSTIEGMMKAQEDSLLLANSCSKVKSGFLAEKNEEIARLKSELKEMEMKYKLAVNEISRDEYDNYKSIQDAKAKGNYFEISSDESSQSDYATEEEPDH